MFTPSSTSAEKTNMLLDRDYENQDDSTLGPRAMAQWICLLTTILQCRVRIPSKTDFDLCSYFLTIFVIKLWK